MNKPCPLYFSPADVLAALSIDTDAPTPAPPIGRRPLNPVAFWRTGVTLSKPLRRLQWLSPRRPRADNRGSVPAKAPLPDPRSIEIRPLAAGHPALQAAAGRGLLSHFAMVQTGT